MQKKAYVPPHRRGQIDRTPPTVPPQTSPSASRTWQSYSSPGRHRKVPNLSNPIVDETFPPNESLLPERCGARCGEWMSSPDAKYCPQHYLMELPSTHSICHYFSQRSRSFVSWMRSRAAAETNPIVQKRFEIKKDKTRNPEGENVDETYGRFLRYAVDVDEGTGYSNWCRITGGRFLDLGFAPGGMSMLCLRAHPDMHGVGITLNQDMAGMGYNVLLNQESRFTPINVDVIEVSRAKLRERKGIYQGESEGRPQSDDADPPQKALPHLHGLTFAIIGITVSGTDQPNTLFHRDLLTISQLYCVITSMLPGAALLLRMHLSLRLIDFHLFVVLSNLFQTKPRATKPLTEFAERKTYWMMFEGFREPEITQPWVERVEKLLEEALMMYDELWKHQEEQMSGGQDGEKRSEGEEEPGKRQGPDGEEKERAKGPEEVWGGESEEAAAAQIEDISDQMKEIRLAPGTEDRRTPGLRDTGPHFPSLLPTEDTGALLETYGPTMIPIVDPVWAAQATVLQTWMGGDWDIRACRSCARGSPSCPRRRRCGDSVLPQVMEAVKAINTRLKLEGPGLGYETQNLASYRDAEKHHERCFAPRRNYAGYDDPNLRRYR